MILKSVSEARTPAYGLRVWADDKTIVVRALDSSGRGEPVSALVVPVERQGERFHLVEMKDSRDLQLCDFEVPKQKSSRESSRKKPVHDELVTLYSIKVPRADWPNWPSVLVLLLYDQSEGVGGNPRPPRPSATDNCLRTLVKEALEHDSADTLRGGLISCGPAGDAWRTTRSDKPQPVTFALASCQYPNDIFNRMPEGEHATRGPVDQSLLALGDRLNEPDPPTLLLLCGDQIYTDATAGLFDPKVSDQRYRVPHERRGQSRGSMAVMQRLDLEVQMMIDDHEIRDNWAPNDPDPNMKGSTAIELGKAAYFRYERGLLDPPEHVWHAIEHKGLPFFLGDTRTEREGRTALNWRDARIMGQEQFQALCTWLANERYKDLPKFVLTPSALLPRRLRVAEQPASALLSDSWEGYPTSMLELLGYICDNEIKGVVFLSGDDHVSNVVAADVTRLDGKKHSTLYSIHSSALYAPYVFANDMQCDFKGNEKFCLQKSKVPEGRYRCDVRTCFAPGDGFAVLRARKEVSGWRLFVDFFDSERNNRKLYNYAGDSRGFCASTKKSSQDTVELDLQLP